MHSLHPLNAHLAKLLPLECSTTLVPSTSPTLQNVLVLCTLCTCSKHSLLSLTECSTTLWCLPIDTPLTELEAEFSCALLALAQCPPGRVFQSIQQLSYVLSLAQSFLQRYSVTLRLLSESVNVLVCPPGTFLL
jgi:hypothetical protein